MDATTALQSPVTTKRKGRPRGPNILSVRMTQAQRQYGLHSSISTAIVAQRQVNISQLEHKAYLESQQLRTATMSKFLQPQEYGRVSTEVRYDRHSYHGLPTPKLDVAQPTPTTLDLPLRTPKPDTSLPTPPKTNPDVPLHQKQQNPAVGGVGLGIMLPTDTKQEQSQTETPFFDESYYRMELNEWATVFDEDDSADDAKEL